MISQTSSSRYVEFIALTTIISVVFGLIIIKASSMSPMIIMIVSLAPLLFYLLTRFEGAFILLYLITCITFLENDEGIAPLEIPFYIASIFLAGYALIEIITGRIKIETLLDKLFLSLTILLPIYVLLGIINGGPAYTALGEATEYFGVLLYFPLRVYLPDDKFQKIIVGIIITFVAFVLIRNILNYREIIIQATLPWEAEKARVSANEFILLMGACLSMAAAALTKSLFRQLCYTFFFIFLVGGLILTQSRGYWIAFFFGTLAIFMAIQKRGKIRIGLTFFFLLSSSLILTSLFFGEILDLIIKGLQTRFGSIGSGKLDLSLLERVLESKTVLGLISENPIAGYGLGYMYTKKVLFFDYFIKTSYVHNGYLAAWFKFGIVGLTIITSIWILNIKRSIKLYKKGDLVKDKIAALTIIGTVSGLMLVNITSPQVLLFESILFVTVFSAYLSSVQKTKLIS